MVVVELIDARYKPGAIKGDMDSIRTEVNQKYLITATLYIFMVFVCECHGTKIIGESEDHNTTYLHRCVAYIRDLTPDTDKSEDDETDARFYPLLLDNLLGLKIVAKGTWSPTFTSITGTCFSPFHTPSCHKLDVTEGTYALEISKDGHCIFGFENGSNLPCKDSALEGFYNEIARYKLDIEVTHQEQNSVFVFSDSLCAHFFGISTFELKKCLLVEEQRDARFYPLILDDILRLKMVAKVKWNPTFRSNYVHSYSNEQTLVELVESKVFIKYCYLRISTNFAGTLEMV
ncbi:putative ADP-ribosylation factor GTPase-activating protein AGD14 [Trifolium repens]|nr:putative ADP-ribosylation factor GTPase-activating protein AGD14 [Trifolium repens]